MNDRTHSVGESLARGWRQYRRAFWPSAGILLLLCLAALGVTLAALSLMPALAKLQLPLVLGADGVGVSPAGFAVLLAEVSIPGAICVALLVGAGFVALVRVFDGVRNAGAARPGASLVFGVRSALRAAMTFVIVIVLVALLAIATPLIMVLGLIGLLVHAVSTLLRRRSPVPWRWALAALIPFGLAAVVLVRWSLAVPLLALEGHDPVAALGRSWRVTRRSPWVLACVLVLAFAAYFALQLAVDALSLTPLPALAVTIISLIVQVLTYGFPLAVLTVLARTRRDREVPVVPLPALRQPLGRTATATAVVAAMLLGVIVAVVPVAPASAVEGDGPATSETGGLGGETPPGETPPGETSPGETPPGEGSGGENPPGQGVFKPTLSAVEGALTEPGAPVTLWIVASEADGGLVPYTFFFEAFLLGSNDERTFIGGGQAAGGGREAALAVNLTQFPLGVGAHRFEVDTGYKVSNSSDVVDGPTLHYTHLVSAIDASTTVTLSASTTSLVADESVQLQAVVASDSGPVAAGQVTFQRVGGGDPNAVTVPVGTDGTALANYSGFTVGGHQLEAVYRHVASGVIATSSALTVTALAYPSELVLTPPMAATSYQQVATFAYELRTPRGGMAPHGTIELLSGGSVLASINASSLPFDGQRVSGTFDTNVLPVGVSTLTARFTSTDGQHDAASSSAVTHEVQAIPVSLSIESSAGWSIPRGASTSVRVGFDLPPGTTAHTGAPWS